MTLIESQFLNKTLAFSLDIVDILLSCNCRSTSQNPGVQILSKLIKRKKTSIFTAVWSCISSMATKSIIEGIVEFLKTDSRLHYRICFEEPCLNFNSHYCNDFDVIVSGLHLTCKHKNCLFTKCWNQGQYIYITYF